MKALFIPYLGYPNLDLINKDLKDCKQIIDKISIESGQILIIDNVTRAEKLEKLNNVCQNNC